MIAEAIMDEENKEGPPFLLEMAKNEKEIEERSKLLKKIEGNKNYV